MTDIIQAKKTAPQGYHYTNAGVLPNEWTSRPLSSIVEEITETAGTREIETVSISAGVGFVNQAEKFGKEHSKVKRSILALKEDVANFGEMFIPSLYIDSYGRKQEDFSMNVERGISLGYFRTHSIHFHQFITTYNRIFV